MSAPIIPSQRVVQAVLDEAHTEGFVGMLEGGAYRLAYVALNHDNTIAHFEQREANEQVRRLRQDHRCPTCGNEDV